MAAIWALFVATAAAAYTTPAKPPVATLRRSPAPWSLSTSFLADAHPTLAKAPVELAGLTAGPVGAGIGAGISSALAAVPGLRACTTCMIVWVLFFGLLGDGFVRTPVKCLSHLERQLAGLRRRMVGMLVYLRFFAVPDSDTVIAFPANDARLWLEQQRSQGGLAAKMQADRRAREAAALAALDQKKKPSRDVVVFALQE